MHMPVMDGLEAAEKIFALNTGIPMVAMTANIMTNDREIYKLKGMNDCVGKPFTSQELWRCLIKYFKPLNWETVAETPHTQAKNELYLKLKNNFVKENRTRFSEIAQALSAGDVKLAHRLAHTLKSNAGHLGKILLQQAAANVEHQLADGQNLVTPEQIAALETELNVTLVELEATLESPNLGPLIDEAKAGIQVEPLDAEAAKELFEKLQPMLEMGSLQCREHIGSIRRIPGTGELIRQMEDLDLEEALFTLFELKKNLGML